MSTIKRHGREPRVETPRAKGPKQESIAVPVPQPMPKPQPQTRRGLSDRFQAQKPRRRAVDEADEYGQLEDPAAVPDEHDEYALNRPLEVPPSEGDDGVGDPAGGLVSRLGGAVVSGLSRLGGAILGDEGEEPQQVGSMSQAAEGVSFEETEAEAAERLAAASDEADGYTDDGVSASSAMREARDLEDDGAVPVPSVDQSKRAPWSAAAAEGRGGAAAIPVPSVNLSKRAAQAASAADGTAPMPVPSVNQSKVAQAEDAAPEEGAHFTGTLNVEVEFKGQTELVQVTARDGVLTVDGEEVGKVLAARADGTFDVEVLGKQTAGQRAAPARDSATPAAPSGPEFPTGRPETYIKTLWPPTAGAQPTREEMVDTVLRTVPEAKRDAVRDFIEHGGKLADQQLDAGWDLVSCGVSDESLKKAFDQVLAARQSPGEKPLELSLVPERRVLMPDYGGSSESGATLPRGEQTDTGTPLKLSVKMTVDAQGKVNGAPLGIDQRTRLSTELTKVGPDLIRLSLKDAGFSDEWIGSTTRETQLNALAKLREATLTPGKHTLDLGFDQTYSTGGGDAGPATTSTVRTEALITLDVDEKGNVNGKPLTIETALATNRVFEQLPTEDKKAMLERFGFKAEDLRSIEPDRATDILARVAMVAREPGEHQLEVDTGPDKFAIGLKVGANGELEGVGVQKIPPPKKKSWFQKIIGPVLTVASFVFPEFAPLIQVAQGALAVANGARGLSLVGSVLGAASGVADLGGLGSVAGTLNSAANVVNGVNATVNAARSGDLLGVFSSAVSLAGSAGSLAGVDLVSPGVQQLGNVARGVGGAISAARRGDVLGAISSGISAVDAAGRLGGQDVVGDAGRQLGSLAGGVSQARQGNYGSLFGQALAAYKGNSPPDPVSPDGPSDPNTGRPSGALTRPPAAPDPDDDAQPPAPAGPGAPQGPTQPDAASEPGEGFSLTPLTAPPVTVVRGDTLTSIARQTVGSDRLEELYAWNASLIGGDPNLIKPGMELEMPPDDFTLSDAERNAIRRAAALPDRPPIADDGLDARDRRAQADLDARNAADDRTDYGLTDYTDGGTAEDLSLPAIGVSGGSAEQVKAAEGLEDKHADASKLIEELKVGKDSASALLGAYEYLTKAVAKGDLQAIQAVATRYPEVLEVISKVTENPALETSFKRLGGLAEGMGTLLTAAEAAHDHTNVTRLGYAANILGQMVNDVVVGKANLPFAILDSGMNAVGLGDYSASKYLGGVVQNVIGAMELLSPADRDQVLENLMKKNLSRGNGAFNQVLFEMGQAASPYVLDAAEANRTGTAAEYLLRLGQGVANGVVSYYEKQSADAAARARLANRVRNIQQGG